VHGVHAHAKFNVLGMAVEPFWDSSRDVDARQAVCINDAPAGRVAAGVKRGPGIGKRMCKCDSPMCTVAHAAAL